MRITKFLENNSIARIKKGKNYISPEIEIIADESLELSTKNSLLNFLNRWLIDHIAEQLNDLINLVKLENKNQYIRALAFRLYENNGVLKRKEIEDVIKHTHRQRRKKAVQKSWNKNRSLPCIFT